MRGAVAAAVFDLLLLLAATAPFCFGANVTYDHRGLVIGGKRRLLISGSIHYMRSTPEMWPDLMKKSKDGGLDVIQTFVFWNLHEPVRGQYDFEGRKDLVKFVKLAGEAGLLVHLRIGPYACAEWNYGGFPLWLHFIPGIVFRTDNEPFKAEMKRFTAKIVDLMKQENLYASQGGPIILSQIENEYGDIDSPYGESAKTYISWAASMAVSLDTGVPWVMCQQTDAPNPIINTCNGFYCDQFSPNSNNKPKMWTENWSGWFSSFGDRLPHRTVEDIAFSTAHFFQLGGAFLNYYMYHGGTNFGRTSGGPFITTSYDYDAPIDEYGLLRQPKWGHLKDVHNAIKLCEEAMVATDPKTTSLGSHLEATVYKTESGLCAAFLANVGNQSDVTVRFNGNSYYLPAWSVSILPDCKTVALNTAKISSVATISKFLRQPSGDNITPMDSPFSGWSWINEPVGISSDSAFTKLGLQDQINTTADQSDYLWYSLSIETKGDEPFLKDGSHTVLHVDSKGHGLYAFINGKLAGSVKGSYSKPAVSLDVPVSLVSGQNKIDLLSLTVGLQNYGAYYDIKGAGVTGPVQLKGLQNGSTIDLSSKLWTYQIGLQGEELGLYARSSSSWVSQPTLPKNQPLVWYKTIFDAPTGSNPVALDFKGMGKGQAWINGQSIGRYWPSYIAPNEGCTDSCNYRGSFQPSSCLKNCGKPTQQFYHIPRSWLQPSSNILVLFEEMGGDPTQISLTTRETESICSHISETHPIPLDLWTVDEETRKRMGPTLSLDCPFPDQVISKIKFASFGTPSGTCGSFSHGQCNSTKALEIVQKACIGARSCSIGVSSATSKSKEPKSSNARSKAVENGVLATETTGTRSNEVDLPDAVVGKVKLRFAPEPSGYLHIGHSKAALLNQYFADRYKGQLVVRFDDTNPDKESSEFVDNLLIDIETLGIKYNTVTYTSDYFPQLMEMAEKLIREGKAYVDDTPREKMQHERMEGIESKCRNNTVEENLNLWKEMIAGSERGLMCCLRGKLDMQDPNKSLRDPVYYRCNLTPHHRIGAKYKIYPTYDFCCPFVDAVEGITHALRSSEYHDRNDQYYRIQSDMGFRKVHIYEFSRLNMVYTLLSKRKLLWFVQNGKVEGWDDPRFPTVQGIVRRGLKIEALIQFILEQGASKNLNLMEWDKLWAINKRIIDPVCPRHTAVIEERRVLLILTDGPKDAFVRILPKHKKYEGAGEKAVTYSNKLWIDYADAESISINEEVTLKDWGNAIVKDIKKDENGIVTQLVGVLHLEGDVKKTKLKLTWLPDTSELVRLVLVDFGYLITKKKLEEDEDFVDVVNPCTRTETPALGESDMRNLKRGDVIQLERKGYYRCDAPLIRPSKPIVLFAIPDGKQQAVAK